MSQKNQENSAGVADSFPIIGIGASAGGLEALRLLFKAMPADIGAGFVLVQHLDPTHDSMMADLMSKYARFPVVQVEDRMQVEANRLHVIPPNAALTIAAGVLHLSPPTERRGLRMPIDKFFSSLAKDQREKAIAIVVSGTGTDGTSGIREIKARGGMVMAQDPTTAGYDGMPRSAIATGDVDFMLPVEEMPEVLARYIKHYSAASAGIGTRKEDQDYLNRILSLLIARRDHDFRSYKKGTINRRIHRRMGLAHTSSLKDYHAYLRNSETEVQALSRDLLIGVTGFFRDQEAWDTLSQSLVSDRLTDLVTDDEVVRVWVPACATGEEAYSIAMLLTEALEKTGLSNNLVVFATDIDTEALEVGRNGRYAESLVADIDPQRLKRFFSREGDTYVVKKNLREKVIFAPQNLITDPPFSNLSLICCRNLLIYIEAEFQERIIRLFHFSLKQNGLLFLGGSETIGQNSDLFRTVSKKWRIYRKINSNASVSLEFTRSPHRQVPAFYPETRLKRQHSAGFGKVAQQALLEHLTPAAVLVSRDYRVLYYHGTVRDYIGPTAGDPRDDILSLTSESLRGPLRTLLRQAMADNTQVIQSGVNIKRGKDWYRIRVCVTPVKQPESDDSLLLVSFIDEAGNSSKEKNKELTDASANDLVQQLEDELETTRDELRNTIEQAETSNEELKASNEEVMSMNEELQSTNEELETSKEELQSLNEELITLNSQLEENVHELEDTNNDLQNLLTSTAIATVFLDRQFRIRRFTPAISPLMRIIPTDIGRHLADISQRFIDPELFTDMQNALNGKLVPPREIFSDDERWYLRRSLPYYSEDQHIELKVL